MATITVTELKELAQLAKDDDLIRLMFRLEGLGVETVPGPEAKTVDLDPRIFA